MITGPTAVGKTALTMELAQHYGVPIINADSRQIYRELKNSGCIDNYLVPNYDILHTMGTQYLVNDIRNYVASRGGAV